MIRSARAVERSLVIGALAIVAACGAEAPVERGDAAEALPLRDGTATRIAVLAPAAAEMLVTLGAGDRIVAVGDFVSWPPSLSDRPRIGAYDAPNVERMLELDVELLVTAESVAASGAHERLRGLGIEVIALDTATWDGTLDSIERLGARIDLRARAEAVVRSIRERAARVRAQVAPYPRRTVLVVVGRRPLYVAGPGSHLDTLVDMAGGRNVARDIGAPYGMMSLEAALERRPEVIVDASDNRPGAPTGRLAGTWETWTFVPAVSEGRVWHVHPDRLSIPGVRLAEMARLMAAMVHPDRLGPPDAARLGPLGPAEADEEPDDAER